MRRRGNIVSILVALVAILTASTWSGPVSACLFDNSPNVVGGAPASHSAHKAHHIVASHKAQTSTPASGGPAAPRLDCAACMAVLPNFPSMAPHELMPFMPSAQTFEPLMGTDPALDPPPPRAARP